MAITEIEKQALEAEARNFAGEDFTPLKPYAMAHALNQLNSRDRDRPYRWTHANRWMIGDYYKDSFANEWRKEHGSLHGYGYVTKNTMNLWLHELGFEIKPSHTIPETCLDSEGNKFNCRKMIYQVRLRRRSDLKIPDYISFNEKTKRYEPKQEALVS